MYQLAPETAMLPKSASGTVASPPVFAASGPVDVADPSTVGDGSGTGVGVGVTIGFGDGSGTNTPRGDGNGTAAELPDAPLNVLFCDAVVTYEPEP